MHQYSRLKKQEGLAQLPLSLPSMEEISSAMMTLLQMMYPSLDLTSLCLDFLQLRTTQKWVHIEIYI